MMIESIRIQKFKSLVDVTLPMGQLTCLIGMNGAGKSTVLQAIDFIRHLMLGDVERWIVERGWKIGELRSRATTDRSISVTVVWRVSSEAILTWQAVFNTILMRCTRDTTTYDHPGHSAPTRLTMLDGNRFYIDERGWQDVSFKFSGSLLSALKDEELPEQVLAMRNSLQQIHSLELLSPQLLRKRSRSAQGADLGAGGEKLSAYLGTLKGEQHVLLVRLLQRFYPQVEDFKVGNVQAGWKRLTVIERFGTQHATTEATHLSDGLLRVLAVLAQTSDKDDDGLVLLDEIENGINQEVMEALVDVLVALDRQILLTTHSPLLLNFLDDDTARDSVMFIYKSPSGESKIRPFFDLPRISEKLRCMGPGDAFVDTDLLALTQECVQADEAAAKAVGETA